MSQFYPIFDNGASEGYGFCDVEELRYEYPQAVAALEVPVVKPPMLHMFGQADFNVYLAATVDKYGTNFEIHEENIEDLPYGCDAIQITSSGEAIVWNEDEIADLKREQAKEHAAYEAEKRYWSNPAHYI